MNPLEGTHRLDTRSWRNQNRRAQHLLQRLALARGGTWRHDPDQAAFPGGLTVEIRIGSHDTTPLHAATLRIPNATPAQSMWVGRVAHPTVTALIADVTLRITHLLTTP